MPLARKVIAISNIIFYSPKSFHIPLASMASRWILSLGEKSSKREELVG
jgi:hypothetical protein